MILTISGIKYVRQVKLRHDPFDSGTSLVRLPATLGTLEVTPTNVLLVKSRKSNVSKGR